MTVTSDKLSQAIIKLDDNKAGGTDHITAVRIQYNSMEKPVPPLAT